MKSKIGYKPLKNQHTQDLAIFFAGDLFSYDLLKSKNGDQYRPLVAAESVLEKFAYPTLSFEVLSKFLDQEPDANIA